MKPTGKDVNVLLINKIHMPKQFEDSFTVDMNSPESERFLRLRDQLSSFVRRKAEAFQELDAQGEQGSAEQSKIVSEAASAIMNSTAYLDVEGSAGVLSPLLFVNEKFRHEVNAVVAMRALSELKSLRSQQENPATKF